MLEPRGNLQPLPEDQLLEVRGGNEMPILPPGPLINCGCHADVPGNVGNMAQNSETPPNKLVISSMIG